MCTANDRTVCVPASTLIAAGLGLCCSSRLGLVRFLYGSLLSIAAIGLETSNAFACFAPASEIYFLDEQDIAAGVGANMPSILEVALESIPAIARPDHKLAFTAFVERVIKGSINNNTIIIVADWSFCNRDVQVGTKGIVIGTFRDNSQGMREFVAISENAERVRVRETRAG
jgi:hypothetical protein